MFERFTDRARESIQLAQFEARRLDSAIIGPEHILLGLLRAEASMAARVLGELGVTYEAARAQIESTSTRAELERRKQIPFDPEAKRVLELSLREALNLGMSYIGTEHLLLALIGQSEGTAIRALSGLGVDIGGVRTRILEELSVGSATGTEGVAGSSSLDTPKAPPGSSSTRCPACGASGFEYRTETVRGDAAPIRVAFIVCSAGHVLGTEVLGGA